MKEIREVEKQVLKAFKTEIPSIYFSDKTKKEYKVWINKQEYLFRHLLNFPPKMFKDCSLIDLGAGTGENTVVYSKWGANCTLVEVNDDACNIAKKVFKNYSLNPKNHKIICQSLFDFKSKKKYDIVVSNGVIHHTGDKEKAFNKMASLLKPNGYLILGIGNQSGCFQRQLKRMIIAKFANNEKEIIEVAEKLFAEDINRRQRFSQRDRLSVIYDSFVVPKQDDPSAKEVLSWFSKNNLKFYSSYPSILLPVMSDSLLNPPTFNLINFKDMSVYAEAYWMLHNKDDIEDIPKILTNFNTLSENLSDLTSYINDFNLNTVIDYDDLIKKLSKYTNSLNKLDMTSYLKTKHKVFDKEVKQLLNLLKKGNIDKVSEFLKTTKQLFQGTGGFGHMHYIAYKEEK